MTFRTYIILFSIIFLNGVSGCTFWSTRTDDSFLQARRAGSVDEVYLLASGDQVRITVFDEPDLSGDYTIGGDGLIAFPLLGEIEAKGVSANTLRERISAALRDGYLIDPSITIEILAFRPIYIYGEVGRSGQHPFVSGLTLSQAVASAGGYTFRADVELAFITPEGEDREVPLSTRRGPVMIRPGDTIRIPERIF